MNLIAAVDKNWAIGKNNELLVSIPNDMKMFRQMTTGKVVVMGRKTLESLPNEPHRERKVPWAVLRRKSMLHVKPVTVYTMMNTNVRQVRSVL